MQNRVYSLNALARKPVYASNNPIIFEEVHISAMLLKLQNLEFHMERSTGATRTRESFNPQKIYEMQNFTIREISE